MSEILSTGSDDPRLKRKNGRLAVAISAVAALLVLALGVGVFAAVRSLSGGGTMPEDVVPADAIAFARLDLDPAAGEKLDALRFMRKFDGLRETLPDGDDADLGRWFAERIFEVGGITVDFERDVAPWIGQRFAVAAVPAAGGTEDEPAVVAVLQVSDEAKAEDGLARLTADADTVSSVVRDGYAFISDDTATIEDFTDRAAEGSLADHGPYREAVEAVGNDSILVGYVDADKASASLAAVGGLASGMLGVPLSDFGDPETLGAGRYSFGMNIEPSYVEFVGAVQEARNLPVGSVDDGTSLAGLPGSTLAALNLAGGGDWLTTVWPDLVASAEGMGAQSAIADFEQQTGLSLPADLAVLLGESLVVAADQDALFEDPAVGMKVRTDAERAAQVVDTLAASLPFALDEFVTWGAEGDYFYVGSRGDHLDALSADGDLGASDRFRTALPDAGSAQSSLWVDLDGLYTLLGDWLDGDSEEDAHARQAFEVLDAVGMTSVIEDSSSATFRLRITVD